MLAKARTRRCSSAGGIGGAEPRLARPLKLLLSELRDTGRYVTHTVYDYFVAGTRQPDKVNVVVRIDVDQGLCLTLPVAEVLARSGVRSSIYFLTDPGRYYNLWSSPVPAQVAAMGFEVGLHTDHYYEELSGGRPALEGIRADLHQLSDLIGIAVRGMVWHGHAGTTRLDICNWQPYKFTDPADLGLAYHDGYRSPYTDMEHTGGWRPATDYYASDYVGLINGVRYLPHHFVKTLRAAHPGESVSIFLHSMSFFSDWEDHWHDDALETRPPNDPHALQFTQGVSLHARRMRSTLHQLPRRILRRFSALAVPALFHLTRGSHPELPPIATPKDEAEFLYGHGITHYENSLTSWGALPVDCALEVGFGAGQWLVALSRHCSSVYGVEPRNGFLRYTMDRLYEYGAANVKIEQAFAEHLPFPSASFDLVLCYGVLMFCRPAAAITEMARVLKPNGQLIVAVDGPGYFLRCLRDGTVTNNPDRFTYGLLALLNTFVTRRLLHRDGKGVNYFTPADLRTLFEATPLRVVDLSSEPSVWGEIFAGQPVFLRCIGRKPQVLP